MELMQDAEKRIPFDSVLKVGARVDSAALRHGLIVRVVGDRLVFAPRSLSRATTLMKSASAWSAHSMTSPGISMKACYVKPSFSRLSGENA